MIVLVCRSVVELVAQLDDACPDVVFVCEVDDPTVFSSLSRCFSFPFLLGRFKKDMRLFFFSGFSAIVGLGCGEGTGAMLVDTDRLGFSASTDGNFSDACLDGGRSRSMDRVLEATLL